MIDNSLVLTRHKEKIKAIGEKNEVFTKAKSLLNNSTADNDRHFVTEGLWAHMKIVDTNTQVLHFIFCSSLMYTAESIEILDYMLQYADHAYSVSEKVFGKLSVRDRQDGFLSICKLPAHDFEKMALKNNAICVVLDGLEIPGNIGTIARTCDGAGIDAMLICNKRARLLHPKFIKGSMGAVFSIPIHEFDTVDNCRQWLLKRNFNIYLADPSADSFYNKRNYHGRTALVVGNERYGLSADWYSEKVELLSIPMLGICDSLNAGVAASIILYDMSTKLKL